jgi:hypothetical protein
MRVFVCLTSGVIDKAALAAGAARSKCARTDVDLDSAHASASVAAMEEARCTEFARKWSEVSVGLEELDLASREAEFVLEKASGKQRMLQVLRIQRVQVGMYWFETWGRARERACF